MHGSNSKKGFVLSVFLHLGVAGTVAMLALVQPQTKPRPVTFELVGPPPPPSSGPADMADGLPEIDFTPPPASPPAPTPSRTQPPPSPPKQVQTPPPQPRPTPTPAPTPRPAPQKAPTPRPAPPKAPAPSPQQPEPEYERITIDEFRKNNPGRTNRPRPTQQGNRRPVNVPTIDTQYSANLRDSVVNSESLGGLSGSQQSALDSYIGRLRDALRRSWDKPVGLAQTIATTVEFEVSANGRLQNVRVTATSGNPQFDQSVVAAFNTLGAAGTPPEGRALRLRLTFRMTDA